MEYKEINKKYVNKLREMYPDYEIPSDEEIKEVLSEMSAYDDTLIGDLIIRIWEYQVDFELV